MESVTNIHHLRIDYRAVSLDVIIKGIVDAIVVLKNQINEIEWYDADWFLEESEPIYGLAFVAFQIYINGSIKDFAGTLNEKKEFYRLEHNCTEGKKSRIELIIALANFAKHKEEGTPQTGTRRVLDYFKLNYNDIAYLDKSPIFQGLTLLNEDWDLYKIKDNVKEWRELLWLSRDHVDK